MDSMKTTKETPVISKELQPLYEEARKYKSAEEFMDDMWDKFAEYDKEIWLIQWGRHDLHIKDIKSLFNWNIDYKIDTIVENIESIDIAWIGSKSYVAELRRIEGKPIDFYDANYKEYFSPEDIIDDLDIDVSDYEIDDISSLDWSDIEDLWLEDKIYDKVYIKWYSDWSKYKDDINNIIENFLWKLDEVSDALWLYKEKQYKPSWRMRARSILWEWSDNTSSSKKYENILDYIREEANTKWVTPKSKK